MVHAWAGQKYRLLIIPLYVKHYTRNMLKISHEHKNLTVTLHVTGKVFLGDINEVAVLGLITVKEKGF